MTSDAPTRLDGLHCVHGKCQGIPNSDRPCHPGCYFQATMPSELEAFCAAAASYVAKHTTTAAAANARMVALGIYNPDGTLASAYATPIREHNALTDPSDERPTPPPAPKPAPPPHGPAAATPPPPPGRHTPGTASVAAPPRASGPVQRGPAP